MKRNLSDGNTLILDFGGVIYKISHEQQAETFLQLGIKNFHELYSHALQDTLFRDLECGKMQEDLFRNELRRRIGLDLSDHEIDLAWNSILVGFTEDNIRLVEELSRHYRLYILSNTNAIHYNIFMNEFHDKFGYRFNSLFVDTFWSFQIGKRKPNPDIYQHVLIKAGLNPDDVLFIDDTKINVEASKQIGMPAIWLAPDKMLGDLFDRNFDLKL
ncbi:MAG: HAD family phosphatase [Bacteroidales bacterium]|nr:HAD family phosphatase [Bacteroidales bacterium]